MDMGVHCIDLMQYVLDTKVRQVAAFQDTLSFHYEVEDSSTVMLRMENGAQCVVQSNFNIPDEAAKWRLEVFGDQGRLLGEGRDRPGGRRHAGRALPWPAGRPTTPSRTPKHVEGERIDVEFGDLYAREIASFCDSILDGKPLEVPAEEAPARAARDRGGPNRSNDEKIVIDL